jgi:hypothetical protein
MKEDKSFNIDKYSKRIIYGCIVICILILLLVRVSLLFDFDSRITGLTITSIFFGLISFGFSFYFALQNDNFIQNIKNAIIASIIISIIIGSSVGYERHEKNGETIITFFSIISVGFLIGICFAHILNIKKRKRKIVNTIHKVDKTKKGDNIYENDIDEYK